MKVVILILGLVLTLSLKGQVAVDDVTIYRSGYETFDISQISTDSVYWFRIKGSTPIDVMIDFTTFSGDAAAVDFYNGSIKGDSIYYMSINGMVPSLSLPLTLVKATYQQTHESDTTNMMAVIRDHWTAQLFGVHLTPNSETGTLGVIIDR